MRVLEFYRAHYEAHNIARTSVQFEASRSRSQRSHSCDPPRSLPAQTQPRTPHANTRQEFLKKLVAADTGVCTDEIIRSYRAAEVDLQKEVHEDSVILNVLLAAEKRRGLAEGGFAVEARVRAELFLDAQQLIVFRDAVGAAGRAGFDLARAGGHSEIRDERIFRFAGTMRNNRAVARFACHFYGRHLFRHAADLIKIVEDVIRDASLYAARQASGVCNEQIVAHQLNVLPRRRGRRGRSRYARSSRSSGFGSHRLGQ